MPPFTVASLATIMQHRPETLPMPVTRPADGTGSPYIPHAAIGESSRKDAPGSSKRSTLSLTSNLPRCKWRRRACSSPPWRTTANRSRSSAASSPRAGPALSGPALGGPALGGPVCERLLDPARIGAIPDLALGTARDGLIWTNVPR